MKKFMVVMVALLLIVAVGLGVFLYNSISNNFTWGNFGYNAPPLVNRQQFNAQDFDKFSLNYSSESIKIFPSADGTIVLEEYMSKHTEDMFAQISQDNRTLSITAGNRPVGLVVNWRSVIYIYLPPEYMADVTIASKSGSVKTDSDFSFTSFSATSKSGSVHAQNITAQQNVILQSTSGSVSAGNISANGSITLESSSGSVRTEKLAGSSITAKSSSGSVRLNSANAETITATSGSGSVNIETINGRFDLKSTSGSVRVENGAGNGTATSGSGSVKLTLNSGLTGELAADSKSGSVRLNLPKNAGCNLHASTGSGSIKTPDNNSLSYDKSGKTATGSFGQNPVYSANLSSGSGSVHLEWA